MNFKKRKIISLSFFLTLFAIQFFAAPAYAAITLVDLNAPHIDRGVNYSNALLAQLVVLLLILL